MNAGPDYNPIEMMISVGARVIAKKALQNGYRTILAGVGASNLAAWLAYYGLREQEHDCDLIAEVGFYGYSPQPADPFIFNLRNVPHCRMLSDVNDVLGSIVGAQSNLCIGALGAGQVDRLGNVNSTCIPDMKLLLVGRAARADEQQLHVGNAGRVDVAEPVHLSRPERADAEVALCPHDGPEHVVDVAQHPAVGHVAEIEDERVGRLRAVPVEPDLGDEVRVVVLLPQAVIGEPGGEVGRSDPREDGSIAALERFLRDDARADTYHHLDRVVVRALSLIHISEPTRLGMISY